MTGKRSEEKKIVRLMVKLYCRKNHGADNICVDCSELIDYAAARLDKCRYGDDKPACQHCPVHCYQPEMRRRIREVMRWAGPRMIFYHPRAAIAHLLSKRNRELRRTR